ncbi:MAG: hypothetical protein ACJAXH_001770 [Colwellia sp.]|jgi:hypothetical protein
MKKLILTLALSVFITSNAYAISQDDITPTKNPKAYNASSCVKASYHVDENIFISKGYGRAGDFRMKQFKKLGKGYYAPNGKYVVANYNIYVATQGQKKAAEFIWEQFNCKDLL